MVELINLLTQNGIGIVCVAFMIYFITTTLKDNNNILEEIQKTLVAIQTNLISLTSRIDKLENKIVEREGEGHGNDTISNNNE